MKRSLLVPCLAAVVVVAALAKPAFSQPAGTSVDRTIVPVRGGLFRVHDGAQHTVFLVTDDGIILVDPLNFDFAVWLKEELEKRFPQRRVTHVIYSAADVDRIGGGSAFNPSATMVAHKTFNERLDLERGGLPPKYKPFDRNTSGTLERDEIENLPLPPPIRGLDRNSDGNLTTSELWSSAPVAVRTYGDRNVLKSGDERVELVYPGRAVEAGATLVYFPTERVLFAATYPSLSAPFDDSSGQVSELVKWCKTVTALDFDTLLTARGEAIPRSQLTAFNDYVNALVSNVAAGRARGLSLEQVLHNKDLPTFSGTPYAAVRDSDLAFLYGVVQPVLVEVYGAALINNVAPNATACVIPGSQGCAFSKPRGPGGSAGLGFLWRHLQVAGEVSTGHQITETVTSTSYRVDIATRDTHVTLLAGVRATPARRFSVDLLGGPTFIYSEGVGVTTYRPLPNNSLPPSTTSFGSQSVAFTLGGDFRVAVAQRVNVIVPLRLTSAGAQRPAYGSTVRAGVGVSLTLFRWASTSN